MKSEIGFHGNDYFRKYCWLAYFGSFFFDTFPTLFGFFLGKNHMYRTIAIFTPREEHDTTNSTSSKQVSFSETTVNYLQVLWQLKFSVRRAHFHLTRSKSLCLHLLRRRASNRLSIRSSKFRAGDDPWFWIIWKRRRQGTFRERIR